MNEKLIFCQVFYFQENMIVHFETNFLKSLSDILYLVYM